LAGATPKVTNGQTAVLVGQAPVLNIKRRQFLCYKNYYKILFEKQ